MGLRIIRFLFSPIIPFIQSSTIPWNLSLIYFRQGHPSMPKIFLWKFTENDMDPIRRNLKDLDNGFRPFLYQLSLLLRCSSLNHADLNDRHRSLLSNNWIQGFEGSRVQGCSVGIYC